MSILVSKVQKLALCGVIYIFTLLTLKMIPAPPLLVCKDKAGFKCLCLDMQVVENLWFLLRGAFLTTASLLQLKGLQSFSILQRTTCVMLWFCSSVQAKSLSES